MKKNSRLRMKVSKPTISQNSRFYRNFNRFAYQPTQNKKIALKTLNFKEDVIYYRIDKIK
jgi:hypothetical protein